MMLSDGRLISSLRIAECKAVLEAAPFSVALPSGRTLVADLRGHIEKCRAAEVAGSAQPISPWLIAGGAGGAGGGHPPQPPQPPAPPLLDAQLAPGGASAPDAAAALISPSAGSMYIEASSLNALGAPFPYVASDPLVVVPPQHWIYHALREQDSLWADGIVPVTGTPGRIKISALAVLLTSACYLAQDATDLPLGSTIQLVELNRISDLLGPVLMGTILPSNDFQIIETFANAVKLLAAPSITLSASSFQLRECCPVGSIEVTGICTLVRSGTWMSDPFPLHRFNVLNCITGCPSHWSMRNPATLHPVITAVDSDFFSQGGLAPPGIAHLAQDRTTFFDFVKSCFLFGAIPRHEYFPSPLSYPEYIKYRALDTSYAAGHHSAHAQLLPLILNSSEFSIIVDFLGDAPTSSFATLIASLIQVILPSSFWTRPLDRATLVALIGPLKNFEYVIRKDPMFNLTGSVSEAQALERIRLISLEVQKEKGLTGGRDRSSDSSTSSSSAFAAREVNVLVAQHDAELAQIARAPNTEAGQVEATKIAVRTGSQWIFQAMVKMPSASEVSVYPVSAKINTVAKAQLPRVVALELLKSAGAHSTAAVAQLTNALPVAVLLGVLKGNFPTLSTFAEFYAAYCSSVSLGQQAENFTISSLTADIGNFSSFVSFLVTFFSALGLVVTQLLTLVSLGTTLNLRLGPIHRAQVLSSNLTSALQTSLTNFASTQETWFKIPALGRPAELVAAREKLVEAKDAVELVQSLDLSAYGFGNSFSAASNASFMSPASQAASSSLLMSPSAQAAGSPQKRKSSEKSKSSMKRLAVVASPMAASAGAANKGQGSNVPTSYRTSQCAGYGDVIYWGGYFPLDALSAGWTTRHSGIAFRRENLGAMLCNSDKLDSFLSRVPLSANARELAALQAWWQEKSKDKYVVERPPDFR